MLRTNWARIARINQALLGSGHAAFLYDMYVVVQIDQVKSNLYGA